jgi:hypothetical protein
MTPAVLDFIASAFALAVMLTLLMVTSSAPRTMRIGITLATSVVITAFTLRGLALAGEGVVPLVALKYLASLKVIAIAWAALDVARIAMRIGTLDAVEAANTARGFLLSGPALRMVWSAWANAIPVPCWAKSVSGEMLAINRSYLVNYGKTADNYIGEKDRAAWPDEAAASFAEHDRIVAETGRSLLCVEPAPTWKDGKRTARFLKFPVMDSRGNLAAIGGLEVSDTKGLE